MGFDVLLVGRKLTNSLPLKRAYKTHRFKLIFNSGFLFYAEYNLRLFFYVLFKKKSILLANDLDTLLANYLASKIQKVKLVYDSHELFTEVPELVHRPKVQKIWLKLEKWILPKLKNTYTVCQSIADYYNNKYGTNFKVVRNVPVLVKKPKLQIPNPKLKKDQRQKTIIYQGALNLGRGLELMIDTMQYLENCQFLVVGDGDIVDQLKEKVTQKKLSKKMLFSGKKTPSELKKITPQADLGISIEEDLGLNYHFALPNKIFDYIHAGVPVLVSNLPEMKQVILDYQVGEIIQDRNPKILAKQIQSILDKEPNFWVENLKNARLVLHWQNEEKVLERVFRN
jgi:glycosyltransferase involved in cell wall biosynthesis